MKYRIHWPIFLISQIWLLTETGHYGWNWSAGSDAELLCDGIGAVLMAMSIDRRPE